MIESLYVRNYVLIDSLNLSFGPGFHCLSGEPGSGTSIILGALSLLLGNKSDKTTIRNGSKEAEISGVFYTKSDKVKIWCENNDIVLDDDTLIIRRVIKEEGRSSYTVNSSPITRAQGAELGCLLVDYSSQHLNQSLLKKETLINLLDEYSECLANRVEYSKVYNALKDKRRELEETERAITSNKEEADYIAYCLNEIDKAGLVVGEEEELKEKLSKLNNSEFILTELNCALEKIKEGLSSISESESRLSKALRKDEGLKDFYDRIDSSIIELDDIYQTIREYSDSINLSEDELDELNMRISTIQRLRHRYGGSVENVLKTALDYRRKLDLINNSKENIDLLNSEVESLEKSVLSKAEELSKKRKKGALIFSKAIENSLHKLGMENAIFKIEVNKGTLNEYGYDDIEYSIQANKGEKSASIRDTSSGGELSRILLSIKAQQKGKSNVETFIFDEIDSGIGGKTANYVASLLKQLGEREQIIAITHLAQIASKADNHFVVEKTIVDGRTITTINELKGDKREKEIARLLSGSDDAISIEHAKKLLLER